MKRVRSDAPAVMRDSNGHGERSVDRAPAGAGEGICGESIITGASFAAVVKVSADGTGSAMGDDAVAAAVAAGWQSAGAESSDTGPA